MNMIEQEIVNDVLSTFFYMLLLLLWAWITDIDLTGI